METTIYTLLRLKNMKTSIFTLVTCIGILLILNFTGIDKPEKFVQFYIQNLESSEKAIELNDYLKTKDGIRMSRTDAASHTIYIILKPGFDFSEKEIAQWLKEKGYTISCFNSGTVGKDSFIKLFPSDCQSDTK